MCALSTTSFFGPEIIHTQKATLAYLKACSSESLFPILLLMKLMLQHVVHSLLVVRENKEKNAASVFCVYHHVMEFGSFLVVWFLFTIHSCANFQVFATLCYYSTVQSSHFHALVCITQTLIHMHERQTFTHKYNASKFAAIFIKSARSHTDRTIVLFIQRR